MKTDRLGAWLDLVFPRACALCAQPLIGSSERGLCDRCFESLVPIEKGCIRCGAPKDTEHPGSSSKRRRSGARCSVCRHRKTEVTRVFAFTVYAGSAIRVARKMKEPRHEPLTEQIGCALAAWLTQETPFAVEHYDAILPIPQHWYRRLTQRYNQSEVLASGLAAALNCPTANGWLHRARWTPKQGMKTIDERLKNMERAFTVPARYTRRIQDRRFLLVDDVMTSGATLDQAAWALKQRGALMVDAVVFARGLGVTKPSWSNTSPPSNFR